MTPTTSPKVAVCYVHPNEVSSSFHACLVGLIMYDGARGQHLMHTHGQLATRCGTDGLIAARNDTAKAILETDVEWLFWLDSDMGYEPNVLEMLLSVAHPTKRPVVGGLCFASREFAKDGMAGFHTSPRPTIYSYTEVEGKMRYMGASFYRANHLIKCDATGSACILIHRSVLKRVVDTYGTWYDRLPGADGMLGEDISFCDRLRNLDIPVFVHTGIRTSHHKPQWVSERDFWRDYVAPPAVHETAVIVPVLRRPWAAAPFMQSLRASTGLANAYAVCDKDDVETADAWEDAGATIVYSEGSRFAVKANVGYRYSHEPYLFFCGDDVRFHPGWLDHAQHVAETTGAQVVATNDMGNAAVMAGLHATHPLMTRAYIDEQGASWDGPGTVAHKEYRHWYVDNEWTLVAQQRGVFTAALASRVEHLHPLFGKGKDDATYRKGQEQAERDAALFRRRAEKYAA